MRQIFLLSALACGLTLSFNTSSLGDGGGVVQWFPAELPSAKDGDAVADRLGDRTQRRWE